MIAVTGNQPPTSVLNAPANNSSYNAPATIVLTATATDSDGTVSKVEFYVNGAILWTVATGGPGNTGNSYSYTWNSVATGTYAIVVRAYDNVGATRDSPTANVNVCGPPTVALTSPPNGQSVTFPGAFTLSATTSAPAATCPAISRVEFYKNGATLITTVPTAPYTYQWTNVAVGDYSLTATVYDSSGASAASAPPVTVHVTPAGNPPTVTLTAPSPGQVVAPGTVVTVTANPVADTAHGRSVANVVLAAKNFSGTVVWSATTYPCTSACGGPLYTATWTTGTAGVFTLTATVTDSVGATGVSPPTTLTVDVPPTVSVASDRSSYPTPATVYLTATANTTVSAIQSVAFFANGLSIGTGTPGANSTYTLTWSTNVINTYSITARVADNFNVSTTSSPITITVVQGGPSTVYYHNDFAGSPLAATDQSGAVLWSESYAPYGERYLNQDTTTRNGVWFAGKPIEDSSGLSYFGGRWYNPMVGRFYSVDPVRFRDSSPLSFNRYAYGNNNPYRYVDPDGLEPLSCTVWGPPPDLRAPPPNNARIDSFESQQSSSLASSLAIVGSALGSPEALAVGAALKGAAVAARAAPAIQGSVSTALSTYRQTTAGETFLHYGYAENAAQFAGGLRPNGFATTASGLSGAEAQTGLSLRQVIPPNAVYTVTPSPGTLIRVNPVTARQFGQPGGLPEFQFPLGTGPGTVSGPTLLP